MEEAWHIVKSENYITNLRSLVISDDNKKVDVAKSLLSNCAIILKILAQFDPKDKVYIFFSKNNYF